MAVTHMHADKNAPHLGGNVFDGDPYSFAPSVWRYVIDRFCPSTVLDLGSGLGHASEWFHKAGMKVVAVDGMTSNVQNAIFPTVQIDLTRQAVACKVDLVHCQELVEHVEEKFIDNVLASLACGKIILMTHAVPDGSGKPGGHHHVNEQPMNYWLQHLARFNCHVLEEDSLRIRKLAQTEGARYMAATGLVLANRGR